MAKENIGIEGGINNQRTHGINIENSEAYQHNQWRKAKIIENGSAQNQYQRKSA